MQTRVVLLVDVWTWPERSAIAAPALLASPEIDANEVSVIWMYVTVAGFFYLFTQPVKSSRNILSELSTVRHISIQNLYKHISCMSPGVA